MDDDGPTRMMGYGEIARAFGMKLESAKRLVRRNRWRRLAGNDRRVRIAVPLSALHTPDGTPDRPVDHPAYETRDAAPPARAAIRRDRSGNDTPDDTPSAAAAITALAEQLRRAGLDLDALRGERDAARAELATTKAEHAALAMLPAQVAALEATLAAMTASGTAGTPRPPGRCWRGCSGAGRRDRAGPHGKARASGSRSWSSCPRQPGRSPTPARHVCFTASCSGKATRAASAPRRPSRRCCGSCSRGETSRTTRRRRPSAWSCPPRRRRKRAW